MAKNIPEALKAELADFQKEVKAFNERIAEASRQYGKTSEIYKRMERAVYKLIPEELVGKSKSGNIKIKQGFSSISKLDKKDLEQAKELSSTAGKYTKKLKKEFQKEYGGSGEPSKKELVEFSIKKQTVKNFAEDGRLKQILSEGGAKGAKRNRPLTYDELNRLVELYDQQEGADDKTKFAQDFVKEHFYKPEEYVELSDAEIEEIFEDI